MPSYASSHVTGTYLSVAWSSRIGCVSRPCCSRSWSLHSRSSATVCPAKNSGVVRRLVNSQALALAPFSQNSNLYGCAGCGQAQDTQVKPPGLFCRHSSLTVDGIGTFSRLRIFTTDFTDPQPPAGPGYGSNFSLRSSLTSTTHNLPPSPDYAAIGRSAQAGL